MTFIEVSIIRSISSSFASLLTLIPIPPYTDCTKDLSDKSLASLEELLKAKYIIASMYKCLNMEEPGADPGSFASF